MRIQTFSIVAGSEACNARCPFCVSKMTVSFGVALREPEVNWRNFRLACQLAQRCGVTTVMLTGKGEPVLFPGQITRFLRELGPFGFPFVELQTNGIAFANDRARAHESVSEWYALGLTTVAISIVHFEPELNRQIYLPHRDSYIDLPDLVGWLHERGLSVRLACVMAKGWIDGVEPLTGLVAYARRYGVEQLSVRPVSGPRDARSEAIRSWTEEHALPAEAQDEIRAHLEREGTRLMTLAHGAVVYDLEGQNVCLTDCLTIEPSGENLRQLIFFPDGHLRYDWQHAGAILL